MAWPSSNAGAKMSSHLANGIAFRRVYHQIPSTPPMMAPGMPIPPFQICGMSKGSLE